MVTIEVAMLAMTFAILILTFLMVVIMINAKK